MPKPCPCTSGRAYAGCCGPLHRGERHPESPEALMRSRFAAFALADAEYLWRTLHPDHEDRAVPKDEMVLALRTAARAMKYMRLTILDARGDQVLFLAGVFEKGKDRSFVELSTFAKDDGAWAYLRGHGRLARSGDAAGITIDQFAREASVSAEVR